MCVCIHIGGEGHGGSDGGKGQVEIGAALSDVAPHCAGRGALHQRQGLCHRKGGIRFGGSVAVGVVGHAAAGPRLHYRLLTLCPAARS